VRNQEVLQRQGGRENRIFNKERKAKFIGHILRRNCILKHVIEGRIERKLEGKIRGGIRPKLWMTAMKREGAGNWKRKR
jgi:hypothetical protein